ncbi:hypothetical protein ABS71_05555 [bacterium SCN 62-11]|nr:hypothetical protein [Candidatus Eremiobacteraeota bacterium]ODT74522.1 MAG: hypothetical protein ABS71_05555 [bacterium SCN 62-11]
MRIASTLPPIQPRRVRNDEDTRIGTELVTAGTLYQANTERAQSFEKMVVPLRDQPNVVMERPLLISPGWNTDLHKFDHLARKLLASGENGDYAVYLKEGAAYRDPEATQPLDLAQIPKNIKVFVNIWDQLNSPPSITAPQLRENLGVLQSVVGPDKVDVVAYSMGGLATRNYLDKGGDGIRNLMILGTPNQGSQFGVLAGEALDRNITWALDYCGLKPSDRPAMHWTAAGSAENQDLNSRWEQQRAAVDAVRIVGAREEATPSAGEKPYVKGDGIVEPDLLAMPDADVRVLEGHPFYHHGALPHASGVFAEMRDFFGWTEGSGTLDLPPLPQPHLDTPYGKM